MPRPRQAGSGCTRQLLSVSNWHFELAQSEVETPGIKSASIRRRAAELKGAEEANERARALLAEQRGKLAEAREFLQDRQESIAALQAQLAVKDAQVSLSCNGDFDHAAAAWVDYTGLNDQMMR